MCCDNLKKSILKDPIPPVNSLNADGAVCVNFVGQNVNEMEILNRLNLIEIRVAYWYSNTLKLIKFIPLKIVKTYYNKHKSCNKIDCNKINKNKPTIVLKN